MSGEPPKKSVLSNRNRRRGSGEDRGSKRSKPTGSQTPSPSKLSSDSLQEHYGQTEIRKALFGKPDEKETLHTLIAGELEFSGAGMGAASPTGSGLDAMGSASVGRVMDKTYDGPADAVAHLRSDGGQLLPSAIRQQAERGLGRDLGSVRLHTDSHPQLEAMGAEAAADGRHIHIDPSKVDLTTAKGKGTLFHELTHVAQAQDGRLPQHGVTSDRGMQTEVEAREVGTLLGRQSATSSAGGSSPQATQMSHLLASTANVMATTLFTSGSDASFDTPGGGWESLVDSSLGEVSSYNEFGSMDAGADLGAPVQTRPEGAAPENAVGESSNAPVMLSESDAGGVDDIEIDTSGLMSGPVARWTGMTTSNPYLLGPLVDDAKYVHFGSEQEAIAHALADGEKAAIMMQDGRYVPCVVNADTLVWDLTWANVQQVTGQPWTNVEFTHPAMKALITADGVVLRANMYRSDPSSAGEDADLMPGATEVLGPDSGAIDADMSKEEFLTALEVCMVQTALTVIHSAEAEAKRYEENASAGLISEEEVAIMQDAAKRMASLVDQASHVSIPVRSAKQQDMLSREDLDRDLESHERRMEIRDEKARIIREYPMLARVSDIVSFSKQGKDEQLATLGAYAGNVQDDIETTRNNLLDRDLDLWVHKNIIDATLGTMEVTNAEQIQWAYDKHGSEQFEDTAISIATAVFSIGLGIGAALVGGPIGLALASGALGVGTADAIEQTHQWFVDSAAGNTNLDMEESIVPPDLAGHWGWLVIAWVGVALDAADVVQAVRAVKAASGLIDEGIELLAKGNKELAERLRIAARHNLTADDVVTLANRDVVAKQLGTDIDIDPNLGDAIQIHYRVDANGRVRVGTARLGPNASIADVLLHVDTVKAMRRYDGVLGKVWELVDKFTSLFKGARPAPGSAAYESMLEVEKLPKLIEVRRAKLGSEDLTKLDRARLEDDIRFLERELAHHSKVAEKATLEAGVGFVAKAQDTHAAAVKAGYPDLTVALGADASKYQYADLKNGVYELRRLSVEDGKKLAVVKRDGAFVIEESTNLSRTEKASQLVESWEEASQAAFRQLSEQHADAYKVVPLKGVAATSVTFKSLLGDIREELVSTLERAYVASKVANADEMAEQMVRKMEAHKLVVVKGTDQLRAYNYRLNFSGVAEKGNELHHLIPLYLGGDHRLLLDVAPDLHDEIHDLFDTLVLNGVQLAPSKIQNASGLNFTEGAAVLNNDSTVELHSIINGVAKRVN